MQVDSKKTTFDSIVYIGDVNVVVKDVGKGPMVLANRSILLSRSLPWLMIMSPATAPRINVHNLGGVLRG